MKKKMRMRITILITLLLGCILTGCGSLTVEPDQKELMITLDSAKKESEVDTHGGFLGDGYSLTVYSCDDGLVLTRIQENKEWKTLPLDDVTEKLIYGKNGIGPYLCDEELNPIFPQVENGYYILIDRQDKETAEGREILDRYSFNFTIGLYDTDTNKLYVGRLDT